MKLQGTFVRDKYKAISEQKLKVYYQFNFSSFSESHITDYLNLH